MHIYSSASPASILLQAETHTQKNVAIAYASVVLCCGHCYVRKGGGLEPVAAVAAGSSKKIFARVEQKQKQKHKR